MDLQFSDFGETRYHLWYDDDEQNKDEMANLSIYLPCAKNLHELGLVAHLKHKLSDVEIVRPEDGYSLTIRFHSLNLNGNHTLL